MTTSRIALKRQDILVTVQENPARAIADLPVLLTLPPQSLADPIDEPWASTADGAEQTYGQGSPRVVVPFGTNSIWEQTDEMLPNEELANSRSEQPLVLGRLTPGRFNFSTYCKPYATIPSASLALQPVLPEIHHLLMSAFGKIVMRLVNDQAAYDPNPAAGNNPILRLEYSLLDDPLTFSSFRLVGFRQAQYHRGCAVDEVTFNMNGDSIASIDWSGRFIEQILTGKSSIASGSLAVTLPNPPVTAVPEVVQLPAGHGKRFMVGGIVYIHDASTSVFPTVDASAGVHLISAVDSYADTITVIRGFIPGNTTGTTPGDGTYAMTKAHAAGSIITPWFPTPVGQLEAAGNVAFAPLHGKFGPVLFDNGVVKPITTQIRFRVGREFYDDEKDGLRTAETIGAPGKRNIRVTISKFEREADVGDNVSARLQLLRTVEASVGTNVLSPARVMKLSFAQTLFMSKTNQAGREEIVMSTEIAPLGTTAGNDEMLLTIGAA